MTTRTCPSCARQAHSADDTSPWDCPDIDCITRMKRDAADLIESLQAQLAKYDEVAAEYGIDGKTMLTLAKKPDKDGAGQYQIARTTCRFG